MFSLQTGQILDFTDGDELQNWLHFLISVYISMQFLPSGMGLTLFFMIHFAQKNTAEEGMLTEPSTEAIIS